MAISKTRYYIETAYTPGDLSIAVNKMIAEGWECLGGLTAVTRNWADGDVKDIQYCQAMIIRHEHLKAG